jgi:hypothetical protein
MGEKQDQPFQLSFNISLKVDFSGIKRPDRVVISYGVPHLIALMIKISSRMKGPAPVYR